MALTWDSLVTRARRVVPLEEDNFFLILAVVIGVLSGLAVVCFRKAIDLTHHWLFGAAPHVAHLRLLLVPTVAGLVLAALVILVFPGVRGTGVNQTKSAVYIYNGYISFRTVIGKFFMCALAIGSGQSLGPEDPSLQMGAGIASILGRNMQLSREKLRLLAPVGAAAGLAAAFNAPIAAVIFVIEEIIGTWTGGILVAVILAAVSSVVVMRLFLGAAPRCWLTQCSESSAALRLCFSRNCLRGCAAARATFRRGLDISSRRLPVWPSAQSRWGSPR
jgi:CIC family chloride channel protein